MSDYPMLISNKLHSFRNFSPQIYVIILNKTIIIIIIIIAKCVIFYIVNVK